MKRLWGIICVLALAFLTLVGVQPATAATSCATARQAAVVWAATIAGEAEQRNADVMCDTPCDSIYSFYLTPNLSRYVEGLVFEAYKTCVAGGAATDGTACGSIMFTKVGTPSITGTLKSGYQLRARTTSWSPSPKQFVHDWYRDGKKVISDSPVIHLDSTYIGKKVTVKVTASLRCHRTKTVASSSSKAIKKNTLPKLKSSQVGIFAYQDQGTTFLGLRSKTGPLWFERGPVWAWIGNKGPWAKENEGYSDAVLPSSSFLDSDGGEYSMCTNGKRYNIGVTMTVAIIGKYDATKITIPVKQYVCVSDSGKYTATYLDQSKNLTSESS